MTTSSITTYIIGFEYLPIGVQGAANRQMVCSHSSLTCFRPFLSTLNEDGEIYLARRTNNKNVQTICFLQRVSVTGSNQGGGELSNNDPCVCSFAKKCSHNPTLILRIS